MAKNFNECFLKLMLPKVQEIGAGVYIEFVVTLKKEGFGHCYQIVSCNFFDRFGIEHKGQIQGNVGNGPTTVSKKKVSVFVPGEHKKIFLSKGNIEVCIVDGKAKQSLKVKYTVIERENIVLNDVVVNSVTAEEETRFLRYVSNIETEKKLEPESSLMQGHTEKILQDSNYNRDENINIEPLPELKDYYDAVLREMNFLKHQGGRKYKVTNGRFVSMKNGVFSYIFDLESELYLTDDAPIKVEAVGKIAEGNVLLCEDFHLIILIDKDLGKYINLAFVSVEPWKLLESLNKRLCRVSRERSKIALTLFNQGRKVNQNKSIDKILTGQKTAISFAKSNPITVIWGPPGTGKTHTMSQIALDFILQGKKVLILSHSNVSVDGVIKKIVSIFEENGNEKYIADGKVLRYGYVRDEELACNKYATSYNYVIQKHPDIKRNLALLEEQKRVQSLDYEFLSDRIELEKVFSSLRKTVRNLEKEYVEKADIIATTISKAVIDKIFENRKYDVVLFDEVSMAYVPHVIAAADFAKEHFICVGDFRQLAPIAQSDRKELLEQDIFTFLNIVDSGGHIHYHPWLVMLNEQRRMHPKISGFSAKYVYEGLLKNYPGVLAQNIGITNKKPFEKEPITLIDLTGTYCAAGKNSDNSRYNILSAMISISTAINAKQDGMKSTAIITPYAAQTRLIRAMIQDYSTNNKTDTKDIVCSTVHQFQGSECDTVIFDAVESYPSVKPGWLMLKNDNNKVMRLINVAATRAKGKFITVVNGRFWMKKLDGTNHIFYNLIKYLRLNGNVIEHKTKLLEAYITSVNSNKTLQFYLEKTEYMRKFREDIERAKEKIVISIPDGVLDEDDSADIITMIDGAHKKGVKILAKSDDYASLPEKWKYYFWGTENATFPLVVIDDKVVWYGIPKSRGKFVEKDSAYLTVSHVMTRFQGKHTVEMIKSLSDLEFRQVGRNRSPLLERYETAGKHNVNSDIDDGKKTAGLASYIEEYRKCPKCKERLTLAKSLGNKFYVKCKKCNHREYLTPELVNSYIDKHHIKCPEHRCNIEAKLNQYGVCIKCDEGHNLKPDEI